jgi:hypothetical protein
MNFKPKKFLSLLTASLLAAGGLVGVAAAPAFADAAAPATYLTYEGETHVSQNGALGYEDLDPNDTNYYNRDFSTWGDYVNDGPSGGDSSFGTMMIKGTKGSGASVITIATLGATSSAVSSTTRTVTMKFKAPAASKSVRLDLKTDNYGTVISATANEQTTGNWQTLTFVFSAGANYALAYNRAALAYDPTSTVALSAPNNTMFIDNVSFNGGQPDAAAPATYVDYESQTHLGASGSLGYENPRDYSTWGDYVNDGPAGGDASFGTMMVKGTKGNNASSIAIAALGAANSAVSSTTRTVTMKFKAPQSGKYVRLDLQTNTYSATISATSTTTTTGAWQTLTFEFSSLENYSLAYNRAAIFYDPTSTVALASPNNVMFVDNVSFNGGTAPQQQTPTVNYDVRLTSALKNTATDAYQWADCGGQSWCANNNYFMKMIAAGASTTLTYVVTEHGTSTLVSGASVKLRMNTGYSGSNATWSSGGNAFGAVSTGNGSDAGFITGTTNGSGEVSFTFANTNTTGEAARTLNNANPYPAGCASPAGQTKAALQPEITAVSGVTLGTQYVDVLWPHISSATIESSIAAGSDGQNCAPTVTPRPGTKVWSPYFDQDKKGFYPHVRLEKSFLNEKLDGTWWDGVWQNRDADTRAYLKYLPVGSTFALTYHVTDEYGAPYVGAKVSLIVNANYSCAKTFFSYEGSLIGPDDCAGGGETELPAKTVGADGRVTFVLTNTNTTGEAMPVDLNGAPNPATKEVGTNIKPNVVGAKQQGIDMLFAHFVEPSGLSKATGPAAKTATIGAGEVSEFTLTDDSGKPLSNTDVKYFVNGFDSKAGFARTDAAGKVRIHSTNSVGLEGMQTVGVSLVRDGKLPLAATATINWMAPELSIAAAGAAKSVVVKVAGAAGQTVQIKVAGKTFRRVAQSAITEFSIPSTAGKKSVSVKVGGKTLSRMVTVTK